MLDVYEELTCRDTEPTKRENKHIREGKMIVLHRRQRLNSSKDLRIWRSMRYFANLRKVFISSWVHLAIFAFLSHLSVTSSIVVCTHHLLLSFPDLILLCARLHLRMRIPKYNNGCTLKSDRSISTVPRPPTTFLGSMPCMFTLDAFGPKWGLPPWWAWRCWPNGPWLPNQVPKRGPDIILEMQHACVYTQCLHTGYRMWVSDYIGTCACTMVVTLQAG